MREPQEICVFADPDGVQYLDSTTVRRLIVRCLSSATRGESRGSVPQDVEDLAQETLLILWRRQLAGRPPCTPPYVAKTAQSVFIDSLRRSGAKKRGPGRCLAITDACEVRDGGDTAEERLLQAEGVDSLIRKAREVLPAKAFAALWLCCGIGLSAAEAAPILGLSRSGVYGALHRARRRLRASLVRRADC